MGLFDRLKQSLTKTRAALSEKVERLVSGAITVDEQLIEDLHDALISSDIGVNIAGEMISELRKAVNSGQIRDAGEIRSWLRESIALLMVDDDDGQHLLPSRLKVDVVIGVNGVGKTTSIAKMAHFHQQRGERVLIAAADTFRAAAVEQIEIWARRTGTGVVKHTAGADPAAVVYDAISAAKARSIDRLIVDTAGRLHNKANLIEEMKKITRVIEREAAEAERRVLLVIDATTGQNALAQAKVFAESLTVDGVILTKLDGTARGGVAVAVKRELGIPVKWVGTGETLDDLQPFDSRQFARALL
ncbi:MAG: signal recognition particle-docking protein FtsY [Negativicutes bacterium]|nr:signal recognition particle-docking protein FtsY [Negativicutes bacterium]